MVSKKCCCLFCKERNRDYCACGAALQGKNTTEDLSIAKTTNSV